MDLFWGGAPVQESVGDEDPGLIGHETAEVGHQDIEDSSRDGSIQPSKPRKAAKPSLRVPGGIPATTKPITTDYDSDDARIVDLKQLNYTDEQVAKTLADEGRIRYQPKTVGSRWQRLRKLLYDKEDERLDDELSDWHIGEDEPLTMIVQEVEKKFVRQRENLDRKKWQEISLHLAQRLGRRKYTGKACKERFQSLRRGNALMPIELDNDQSGRARLREARIARNKQERTNAENAVREAEAAKKNRQLAKKKDKDDADQARTTMLEKRRAEKAEHDRIKEERRTNKEQAIQQRRDILAYMRCQRKWIQQKRTFENEKCIELSGLSIYGKPTRTTLRRTKDDYDCEDTDDSEVNDLESDEEALNPPGADEEMDDQSGDSDLDDDTPLASRRLPARKVATKSKARLKVTRTQFTPDTRTLGNSHQTVENIKEQTRGFVSSFNKAPVSKESLQNPRSILSNDELDTLLTFRELPRRNGESHAEVVARILASDHDLKGAQLDALLGHYLVKAKGMKKVDKIRRLQECDAGRSRNGQAGVSSTNLDFIQSYEGYSGPFANLVAEAVRESGSRESNAMAD